MSITYCVAVHYVSYHGLCVIFRTKWLTVPNHNYSYLGFHFCKVMLPSSYSCELWVGALGSNPTTDTLEVLILCIMGCVWWYTSYFGLYFVSYGLSIVYGIYDMHYIMVCVLWYILYMSWVHHDILTYNLDMADFVSDWMLIMSSWVSLVVP